MLSSCIKAGLSCSLLYPFRTLISLRSLSQVSTMEDVKLHVVMMPWLGFGHMIPFFELTKCLAERGHRVSFISTPRNIERLPDIPPHLSPLINLVKLSPPPIQGLKPDAQATVDVSLDQLSHIEKLLDAVEEPMIKFLKDQDPLPDWIFYDLPVKWAPRMAQEFGLSCAFFSVYSALALCFIGPPWALFDGWMNGSPEQLMQGLPWMSIPSKMAYRYVEALQITKHASDPSLTRRFGTSIQGCNIVAIRSRPEFEPEWFVQLAGLYQKQILPVGFLPPPPLVEKEDEVWEDGRWLDTQKHGSTVYVAFGSELRLTQEQVSELAFGLELSGLPFFWSYRGDPVLLPTGFEQRTKARGLVRMGWAPQSKLLAHPSIGCFLMHGGWGSSIESLTFGKPLVMLPMIADQWRNGRVMEEKKVGLEVPRNERDGSFKRDAVANTLRLVMLEAEGEAIRATAREMQNIFADKLCNDQCIDELVHYLVEHRCKGVQMLSP